ncbi:LysR family transcriptional regulator [Nannocystaceae bacterium ST9]
MDASDLGMLVHLDALLQARSVTEAARKVGLSTAAMSHALARIRVKLGDPILVRSGRAMVLTPRAEALAPKIRALIEEARAALVPERPFEPATLEQSFMVLATDYVLSVLGTTLDRVVALESPGLVLRFVPNTPDDAALLRAGGADLAVGIYAELPPELRTRQLLTDRFVCVVREGHPSIRKAPTLEQFVTAAHVQIAPRGQPGGYVDDVLAEQGLARKIVRAMPYFIGALQLVAQTNYVLTISERLAKSMAKPLGLRVFEVPLELRPYALSLLWHPRFDGDAAHRWLRDAFVRAAKLAAGDVHEQPRTRLG